MTRKEFSALCVITHRALSVYIKRQQVIEVDGDIDPAQEINQAFIERRKLKLAEKGVGLGLPVVEKGLGAQMNTEPVKEPKSRKQKPVKKVKNTPASRANKQIVAQAKKKYDVDLETKQATIAKVKRDTEIADMKLRRMTGQVIPTDVVKALFMQHFKSMVTSFRNGLDRITIEFSKKGGMNRNDIAELRKSMLNTLNECVDKAVDSSKLGVEHIVAEYSQRSKAA